LLANGAMLGSTPVDGGRYFVDLAAGIAVAVGSILAARTVSQWIGRSQFAAQADERLSIT
jgi:hypothetical protein